MQKQVGILGMAVMGKNLALNLVNHGYQVSIYDRSHDKTDEIIKQYQQPLLSPYYSIHDLVQSLSCPRCILLLIKSGEATDTMINAIKSHLTAEDIIIDAGNSDFRDTIRRYHELASIGINFVGMGVSGGEQGALNGPAMMVGGSMTTYQSIEPMLKMIAAKYKDEPCVTYVGSDGAGHYTKMVHNGIEYGDMQLIAEVYALLKVLFSGNNDAIAEIFEQWNESELNGYLIEITAKILRKKTNNGCYLVDLILDEAQQKGTGKLASQEGLALNIPLTVITEAVFARFISAAKQQRQLMSQQLSSPNASPFSGDKTVFIEDLRRALYLGKIIAYEQGFYHLKMAGQYYHWSLNCANVAKIFRAGCIIRAGLLQKISEIYMNEPQTEHLLFTPYFTKIANQYHNSLRRIVVYAITQGIAVPALSAAINYYDSYRSNTLPTNLIQAQRDFFGAHTYRRIDQMGDFHSEWQ